MPTITDTDSLQAEFAEGVLTDVEADVGDYLRLADTDVLSFDGVDDYVESIFSFTPTAFTYEFWIKPLSFINYNHTQGALNGWGTLKFHSTSDQGIYVGTDVNTRFEPSDLSDGMTQDAYQHFAFVFDNGDAYLYKDETQIGFKTGMSSPSDFGGLIFGSDNSNTIDGELFDVRLWNTARTQTEIQNNMHKRLTGDEPGLVAYYKLDEGTGTVAIDSAGANDGDIIGACLPGYTEILTTEGNKRIDEIEIGDKIISYTDDGPIMQKVEQFHDQGVKQTYELKTGNRRIFVTNNHPFLTAVHTGHRLKSTSYRNKVKTRTWELQWKRLDKLEAGDAIVVYTGDYLPQENNGISEDLCKIIGCYFGDGYTIHRKDDLEGIGFSLYEQQKRDKYEKLIFNEFGRNPSTYRDIVLYSKDTAHYFRELGLDKKCLYKEIPHWTFSLSKEKKEAIIEGFLDSDGYQNKHGDWIFELANEQLIKDLKWLAIEAGYEVSNIRYRDRRDSYSNIEANRKLKGIESWTFSIFPNYSKGKGIHRINKPSKKERVHIELPGGYKFQNISSIKKYSEEKVYDIGLKDVHNFVAEGIVVHNSWQADESLYFMNPDEDNNRLSPQLDLSAVGTVESSLVSWEEQFIQDVLSFDGVDDYVDISGLSNIAQPVTIEVIARFDRIETKEPVFSAEESGAVAFDIGVNVDPLTNDTITFGIYSSSSSWTSIDSGITPLLEEYYHLAAVWANDTMKFYVNGNNVGQVSKSTINSNSELYLGCFDVADTPEYLQGVISETRRWNHEKTQQEIQDNMNKRLNGDEPGLVAYYPMDEGSGDTVYDNAGSNDGAITGATYTTDDFSDIFTNDFVIDIETRISEDNGSTWTAWTECTNGDPIPDLPYGLDASTALLECKQSLSTSDVTVTPELNLITVEVNGEFGSFFAFPF